MSNPDQEIPKLSASIARRLLDESPLSAWCQHRLLGNIAKPLTSAQIKGIVNHAVILGGDERLEILPYAAFRSNEAKEARDRVLAEGKIPISQVDWEDAKECRDSVWKALFEHGVGLGGAVEQRLTWKDEGVWCTGVLDHWGGGLVIDEIKTGTAIPTREYCERHLVRSHSHLQDPAYRRAVANEIGCDMNEVKVRFSFVQVEPPFACFTQELTGAFKEFADIRWRRARDTWARCLSEDSWPGPDADDSPFNVPAWALSRELALEAYDDE